MIIHENRIYSTIFVNEFIMTGSSDCTIKIMDQNFQVVHTVKHKTAVIMLVYSAKLRMLATGVFSDIILYDSNFELQKQIMAHNDMITGLVFIDKHSLLVSSSLDRQVIVWCLKKYKKL